MTAEEIAIDAIELIRRKAHACNRTELSKSVRNEIRDLCDLTLAKIRKLREITPEARTTKGVLR